MISNRFPINNGNATVISEKVVSKTKLVMKRFENMFDYFSEEPVSIMAKEKENSAEYEYTCILRIRIWNNREQSYSWSIYSRDREELNSLIIRKVTWDLDKDMKYVKKNIKENRDLVLSEFPSIAICNKYILSSQSNQVIRRIESLDEVIGKGFLLSNNKNPKWEWRDLEVLRLYDWGQIHITWCTEKKNEKVEEKIEKLIMELNTVIEKCDENITSMTINYDSIPEF